MRLVYCIHSTYNPGGMERVLLNKVRYLVGKGGYEISIVTTDQKGRRSFFPFPSEVKMTDLGINYTDDKFKDPFTKIAGYFRRKRLHKKRLTAYLKEVRADIVISLYPCESSFIPSIKDGSKKILEFHQCKLVRLCYDRKGIIGLTDKIRTRMDEKMVRRFDRFVVLTEEDKGYWGDLPNILVIPNAALAIPEKKTTLSAKRVIAVGRLDHQKAFDRLIKAWSLISPASRPGWRLDIFGQGEWEEMLKNMITELGLSDSVSVNRPTQRIFDEYSASAFLAMTSHYEGFPMVMIEAMSCGLPVVTFDYPCGPKDIITEGVDGLIVKDGDLQAFANAMASLMNDKTLLESMSAQAPKVVERYSEEKVMEKWENCFRSILS